MTREELIEVMARAIDPVSATNMAGYAKFKGFDTREVEEMKRKSATWSLAKSKATAAITAIEAQGLAIVPVEATAKDVPTAVVWTDKPEPVWVYNTMVGALKL